MLKRTIWAGMALVFLQCASLLPAQDHKGPRIEVKEIQHDFGKVAQGTRVDYVFQVRNAGNEPLVIERVVPS